MIILIYNFNLYKKIYLFILKKKKFNKNGGQKFKINLYI